VAWGLNGFEVGFKEEKEEDFKPNTNPILIQVVLWMQPRAVTFLPARDLLGMGTFC
jgi:hypothetical protein